MKDKKTVIVFGGGGEIGMAVCCAATHLNFNVVIADIAENKACSDFDFIRADLTVEAEVKRVVLYALEKYQTIDAVVNCQGLYRVDSIEKTSGDNFDQMIDINIKSVFLICKNIIPVMKWRRDGYIINIASMSGLRGKRGQAVYCASKFAVVGLTEALFEEIKGTGVRISVVCPGSVDTKMLRSQIKMNEQERDAILHVEDVAHVVMDLLQASHRMYRKIVSLEGEMDLDKQSRKK
jgi:NAD(P)-dependent dehydrogenase (short-subunit alcohol dehydrogenase family)